MRKFQLLSSVSALLIGATAFAPVSWAQDASDEAIEEVVVTGSRRAPRSTADTPAPVDVISGDTFANQGDGDMTNLLRNVIPSYNVNAQPISDAATLVRPANLRTLAPDQTLVLLNGKRRHRAAVIAFLGGGISDGSQGPDISVIPAIALKRVEVLRDGAAAQYGSDAIAGVINFVLKDSAEGGSFEAKWGQTYAGDGSQRQLAANYGFPVTDSGFINISAEWREQDATSRSIQRDDALGLIAAGNTDIRQPYTQIWGQPELRNDWKVFLNFAVQATDSTEIYAFGNYAEREVEGGFFFRNPDTRGGVNSGDSGVTRLVGDMTPDDGITCPGGINFNEGEATTGTVADPLVIGSAGEDAAMAAIFADPNCWVFNEMFPGGFTPQFGGNLNDIAAAIGFRGEMENGLTYDVSVHAGRNQVDFFILNTINASLGSGTPNEFDLGSYIQLEKNFNADFTYPVDVEMFASPLNVAFGFEWREEQFEAVVGGIPSWENGVLGTPFSLVNDLGDTVVGTQGFGVGANGFSGFSPQVGGINDRTNIAIYLDLEADVTEDWILGAAVRYEDFSDFGSTTNFKVSSLYKVGDSIRFRATYSTGFRAPTVGQQQVVNISTVFESVGGVLQLAQRGTIPPTNPIAVAAGADPLGPEESKAFTLGVGFDIGGASITIDYFNIKLTDRITQSASQSLTDAQRDALVASGVGFAADLAAFRFFVNDFDTRTTGIDVVGTMPLDLFENGTTTVSLVANYAKNKVIGFNSETLDPTRKLQLEANLPKYRGNLTLTHVTDSWRALARVNYYGKYTEVHLDSAGLEIYPGSEITLDAELGYSVMSNLEISVGADNLFSNYPDLNPFSGIVGAKYGVTSPMGFNGGYYYVRGRYSF
jgi:iron complex outermembrane receptor protein